MIGTPLTITNHETGDQIILNDHVTDRENVIALQQFPTFEPELRAQNLAKQGAHGEVRLPHYYSGMSVVLNGVIVGEDEAHVWAIKKQFDAIMRLSRTGFPKNYDGADPYPPMFQSTVRLSFTDPAGQSLFIDATPIQAVSYNRPLQRRFLLNFQVILRSPSPFLIVLDGVPNVENGSLGNVTQGLQLPFNLPFTLAEQHVQGGIEIEMTTPGYAILTMQGSDSGVLINPKITNTTNGTYVKILRPLSGAARYFKIDGLYQTMTDENGASVAQYADGDFIYLDEGVNQIVYTADAIIPN